MTLDRARPVQTRDGRPVRIITWTEGPDKYPIVGVVEGDSEGDLTCWTSEGNYLEGCKAYDGSDLINVSERKSLYMSFYKEGRMACWPSRVAADAHKTNRIVLIRVDLEDGVIVGFEREL